MNIKTTINLFWMLTAMKLIFFKPNKNFKSILYLFLFIWILLYFPYSPRNIIDSLAALFSNIKVPLCRHYSHFICFRFFIRNASALNLGLFLFVSG